MPCNSGVLVRSTACKTLTNSLPQTKLSLITQLLPWYSPAPTIMACANHSTEESVVWAFARLSNAAQGFRRRTSIQPYPPVVASMKKVLSENEIPILYEFVRLRTAPETCQVYCLRNTLRYCEYHWTLSYCVYHCTMRYCCVLQLH